MPGPLLTVTISESARRGYIAGPLLMVGHGVLELALVVAIRFGLDAYLKMAPVMAASALFGGSVLLYLGIEMVRTAGRQSIQDRSQGSSAPGRTPVLTGALTSLANPYWTLLVGNHWSWIYDDDIRHRLTGHGRILRRSYCGRFRLVQHGFLRSKQGRHGYAGPVLPGAGQGMRRFPRSLWGMVSRHGEGFFPRNGFLKNPRTRFG